jgi:hypothetical protein
MLDVVLLSRIQFGFTLAFHILFPTLTIGLALFIVWWEALWVRSGDEAWLRIARFWSKLFALAFGIGVVSGIVLSFEFGTNFAGFARATGNVLGPLLAYEVLTAFFLEASFLPVMLFGWGRVSPRLHLAATAMVALGTVISAFWILSANSWMQTPAGYSLRDGVFFPADWWAIVFNPSFPYRLAHMLNAALVTGAFTVAGISAWHLLHGRHVELARRTLRHGVAAAVVLAPLQVVIGDLHGLQVQRDQPMKVAAMEALWETRTAAPFVLLARSGRGGEPLRARHPLRQQPAAAPRPARRGARPRPGGAGGPAERAHRLLRLSPHAGGGLLDAGGGGRRRRPADAAAACGEPPLPVAIGGDGAAGVLRRGGRLGGGGGRAPALGGAGAAAHRRQREPAGGRLGGRLPRPVLRRLQPDAVRLPLLPASPGAARPGGGGGGAPARTAHQLVPGARLTWS